jgi:hypothetical protein
VTVTFPSERTVGIGDPTKTEPLNSR